MFKTRLISGAILVLLALIVIIAGGNILLFSTLAISLVGMFDVYRVFQIEKSILAIITYIIAILYYCNLNWGWFTDSMMITMFLLIVLMFAYVFTYPKFEAKQLMVTFFGLFYVAVMLSYVYQIRMLENGVYLAFLIFICSWGCDTCAYCVGMLIGKHKMAPVLSPKKSIEGAVGGVLGTALLTVIYLSVFRSQMHINGTTIAILATISAVAAFISMVGDLTASAIKRS